ncbi:AAA family ATPase [Streptacidiphilus sp. N1-3]|uniref:AAA family ATPase n=1 Tax=Streptacidiphilus alkalitolerans TaxID=3342712 RepID=A0ABV6WVD9_9ACTN
MITRIAIDGFKSFADFELALPPFLLLVGANASGKSNFVDALRLVARAQVGDSTRDLLDFERGAADQLFRRRGNGEAVQELAVQVQELVRTHGAGPAWESGVVSSALQGTLDEHPLRARLLMGGPGLDLVSHAATSAWDLPRNWLFLDADLGRAASRASGRDAAPLSADAANLAAVLGRLQDLGLLPELLLDAMALIPALDGIQALRDHRGDWDYDLVFRGAGVLPPILASHGTLRVLALLAALHDPTSPRTIVVDEIETGLHPSRLKALIAIVHRLVEASREPDGGYRLQVIATTHSPVALAQALSPKDGADVRFVDTAFKHETVDGEAVLSPVTRARTVRPGGERGSYVSAVEVQQFLDTVRQDDW